MTNWCFNTLNIHGPKGAIDGIRNRVSFYDEALKNNDDLNIYHGIVDQDIFNEKNMILATLADDDGFSIACRHLAETIGISVEDLERYHVLRAFDLCENGYECNLYEDTASLILTFDSSWGPSFVLLEYLIRKHPGISIDMFYEESGMHIYGKVVYDYHKEDPANPEYEYIDYDCTDSRCIENPGDVYSFVENCFDDNSKISFENVKEIAKEHFKGQGCNVCPYQNNKIKCNIMRRDFFEEAITAEHFDEELEECYEDYIRGHQNG